MVTKSSQICNQEQDEDEGVAVVKKAENNHVKISDEISKKMDFSGSDDSDTNEIDTSYQEKSSNGFPVCRGCSKEVTNQYYLRVNETSWHEECLKCNYCNTNLECQQTCFIKKKQILCKIDYYKHFGIKCAKCSRNIQSSDWVRRAKDNVYHLACFACENCKRQLSTGEEFALHNNKLLCKTHYCELIDGDTNGKEDNSKLKNKRVRTTFTEEQLQILQANFDVDSNPDGQDLERIAQVTGLSKRVTQVWFQNSRARQKKYKEKKACSTDNENLSNDGWNDSITLTPKKRNSQSKLNINNNNNKQNRHINALQQHHNCNGNTQTIDGAADLSWSSESISDVNLAYENDSSSDMNHDLN